MAGSRPIEHGDCLTHGPVCLRPHVARKFIGRFGNNEAKLKAWASKVSDRWNVRVEAGAVIPYGDDFAFWTAAYDEDFGQHAKPKGETPRVVAGTDQTDDYLAKLRSARG